MSICAPQLGGRTGLLKLTIPTYSRGKLYISIPFTLTNDITYSKGSPVLPFAATHSDFAILLFRLILKLCVVYSIKLQSSRYLSPYYNRSMSVLWRRARRQPPASVTALGSAMFCNLSICCSYLPASGT